MMQQWTGVNFIFYFGSTFFKDLGTIQNPFFTSLITTLVNVFSTPISFYTIERFGRRKLMLFGAAGQAATMCILAGTTSHPSYGNGIAAATMLFLFNTFFAIGWLGMTW